MNRFIDIVRESIQLYKKHASIIAGYLAWLLLPFAAFVVLQLLNNEDVVLVGGLILMTVTIVLWIWMSIFLIKLIDKLHDGKKPNEKTLQQETGQLILPLLTVALFVFLSIVGGLILLVIPGIIFFVWYTFAQISVVLDKKRGMEALKFSRSLVQGRFFKVAWYVFSGPLLMIFVYSIALASIIYLIASLTGTNIELVFGEDPPLWLNVLDTLGQIFIISPLLLIYSTIVYKKFKKLPVKAKKRDETKEV